MDRCEVKDILNGYSRAEWIVAVAAEEVRLASAQDRPGAERRLVAARAAADRAKADTEALINLLDDKKMIFILRFRYVHLVPDRQRPSRQRKRKWEEVASAIRYSVPRTMQLHAAAIDTICSRVHI